MNLSEGSKHFISYLIWLACYCGLIHFLGKSGDVFFGELFNHNKFSYTGAFIVILSLCGFITLGFKSVYKELDVWEE